MKQVKALCNAYSTQPLRFHLSVIIITLLVAVSGVLIGFNFFRGREAGLNNAEEQMRLLSERIIGRFDALFRDAKSFVTIASSTDILRSAPPQGIADKIDFLGSVLSVSPDLDTVYTGYATGDFILAANLAASPAWSRTLDAPEKATLAVRTIVSNTDGARKSTWRFFGSDRRLISSTSPVPANYDPRTRPWYAAAQIAPVPVSTAPYMMFTIKKIGITVSQAHRDDPNVIIGVDVILEAINRLLRTEKISPGSSAYVIDGTGKVVVSSDDDTVSPPAGSAPAIATLVSASLLVAIQSALRATSNSEGHKLMVEADGRQYLAWIANVGTLPSCPATVSPSSLRLMNLPPQTTRF